MLGDVNRSIYQLPSSIEYQGAYDKLKYKIMGRIKKNKLRPVIIVPGFGDCYLLYNHNMIWPIKSGDQSSDKLKVDWSDGSIKPKKPASCFFKQEYSPFNLFLQDLKSLGYTYRNNYKTFPYDFRVIGEPFYMNNLLEKFTKDIFRVSQNTGRRVTIICNDFGCVLTQIFLNNIEVNFREQFIESVVMLNPTIGGNIYALKSPPKSLDYCFTGIQMQLPHPYFYGDIINEFFENVQYKVKYFYEKVIKKFQEKSFVDTGIKIYILRNKYSTNIRPKSIEIFRSLLADSELFTFKVKNEDLFISNRKVIRKIINIITYKEDI